MSATTEARQPQSKLVDTIVMIIAIVAAATRNRAACRRILVRGHATQAAMPNGAEKRALHRLPLQPQLRLPLQLRRHRLRPLLRWITCATTAALQLQSKAVVTIAMTIAIVAAATRSRAACLWTLAWELAMRVAMPNGVGKHPLPPLQLRHSRLQPHHPPGQFQVQSFRGMATMWFFTASEPLARSTWFVGWA